VNGGWDATTWTKSESDVELAAGTYHLRLPEIGGDCDVLYRVRIGQ